MGKLIYTDPKTKRQIELPIRELANPLEGTFDLSRCGDTGQYLSISTGYRKGKKTENANKLEIWIAPRFLIERNLTGDARHLEPIMNTWNEGAAPVGLFWTWGPWGMKYCDYLTTQSLENLSDGKNLYEKWLEQGPCASHLVRAVTWGYTEAAAPLCVSFLN